MAAGRDQAECLIDFIVLLRACFIIGLTIRSSDHLRRGPLRFTPLDERRLQVLPAVIG